jgi:hypothetical protein
MIIRENTQFDTPAAMRLATWGTGAALALALAVVTGFSANGERRAATAVAALTGSEDATRQVTAAQPRPADTEVETRRLNEAIRLLAADRDRLLTRIGSIERNLDDMTGSVNRQAATARQLGSAGSSPLPQITGLQSGGAPPPNIEMPNTTPSQLAGPGSVPPAWMLNGTVTLPAAAPAPPASAAPRRTAAIDPAAEARPAPAAKTEFGVDLGSAPNLDAARQMWSAVKAQHAPLLGNLRPNVAVRENRAGETEIRVIIGPFTNAYAAAKLCASLGAADVMCSATAFDGQRLAIR